MSIIEILFWVFAGLFFWTYFGYPVALTALAGLFGKKVKKREHDPYVSLIVTAYNEEKGIRKKLDNSRAIDYPDGRFEVLIVSDGSTDKTEEIVTEFEDDVIQLIALPERMGKHFGQRKGIERAKGEILILTDATTYLEPDAVRRIVEYFGDPSIGCVSGNDSVRTDDPDLPGEGFYVQYEMKLRELESRVGSLVGVSGCFFAIRKDVCTDWIDNMSSDFYLPIMTKIKGFRTVLAKEAIGYYELLHDPQREFIRKVRTVVHGLEVFFKFKRVLNVFKYGSFSIQIMTHKLSRWLVPLYMFAMFVLNLILLGNSVFYALLFMLQCLLYGSAFIALVFRDLQKWRVFRIPLFFVMVNLSIIVAWYDYLIGKEFVLWEPTRR